MVKSAILDQFGRPIEKQVLGREIATPELMGVRRTVEDAAASGLTPEGLAQLLRQAATGDARKYLTLAEEMEERYLHYASQLQTRRLAVEGISPSVEVPKGVPTKIADAVHRIVEDDSLAETLGELTDAIGKGYAVVEMMWEYQDGLLRPVAYKARDPRYFQFDRLSLTELRLATDYGLNDGEPLPAAKFIRHMPRSKLGIPIRRGMARPAAWAFLIQSFTLKDWAAFAEVYGMPLRLGRYHSGASDADKRALLRAVRDLGSDAAAICPQGMEIEFVKVEGQHGAAVYGNLIDYVDKQVSKLVVGQTMTSDDGASMAQAKVHNEVRMDIVRADCKQLAQTINRDLIEPFVAMNFGPQPVYPRVALPVAEPEDTKALADSLGVLVPLGLKVAQNEIRERLGLSEPEAETELLGQPAGAAAGGSTTPAAAGENETADEDGRSGLAVRRFRLAPHRHRCTCGDCRTAALAAGDAQADDLDEIVDAALAEDWEEIADPVLEPFFAAVEGATDYEDARRRIEAALQSADSSRLVDALARATMKARGLGDARD